LPPGIALDALVDDTRASLGLTRKLVVVRPRPGESEPQPDRQQEHLQQFYQLLIEPIVSLLPPDANAPVIFIPQSELFSITEAEAIAPLFHTEPLTRGDTTKSAVVQR
jgi:hypothetical protein